MLRHVHENIFRLDVPVHDFPLVQVVDRLHEPEEQVTDNLPELELVFIEESCQFLLVLGHPGIEIVMANLVAVTRILHLNVDVEQPGIVLVLLHPPTVAADDIRVIQVHQELILSDNSGIYDFHKVFRLADALYLLHGIYDFVPPAAKSWVGKL